MRMCEYACVCACMHECILICMCVNICVCVCAGLCVHVCVRMCAFVSTCVRMCMCVPACASGYQSLYVYVCVRVPTSEMKSVFGLKPLDFFSHIFAFSSLDPVLFNTPLSLKSIPVVVLERLASKANIPIF